MPTVLDANGRTLTDRVWLALDAEPWSTAADIADELGARPSSISNILQNMVMCGRAERVRSRRNSSVARVWSYRIVATVPEHLL
jgi:predicted transcriptional regulator